MEHKELLDDIQDSIDSAKGKGIAVGSLNDGCHSFDTLYRHRIALFIALCKAHATAFFGKTVWMSKKQSDGHDIEGGWFLLGIGTKAGKQITYHIPISEWDLCRTFATEKRVAPEFDGHTPADCLTRIAEL